MRFFTAIYDLKDNFFMFLFQSEPVNGAMGMRFDGMFLPIRLVVLVLMLVGMAVLRLSRVGGLLLPVMVAPCDLY